MTGSIVGNYRLARALGACAGGRAHAAVHRVLPRHAIVKVAAPGTSPVAFLREACLLEALADPGVPRVYESGLLADRRPWFAIEALATDRDGAPIATLADRLRARGGALAIADVLAIVHDLARAIEHAHRRGVIVRGVRPDRVAMAARGELSLCIADWSDARPHDHHRADALPSVLHAENRRYLAPEQLRGEADDRADVWALGAIAYELLTGAPARATSPRAHRADVPAALAALVDQLLADDRFDRPAIGEARAALAELRAAEAAVPPPPIPRLRWTPPLGQPIYDDEPVEVVDLVLE